MEMQSYWLSETPYVPASRYAEQSICPRICNEALFEDLETGKVFRIVNTHLDHNRRTGEKSWGLRQDSGKN